MKGKKRYLTYKGETKSIAEWAKELEVNESTIRRRLCLFEADQYDKVFTKGAMPRNVLIDKSDITGMTVGNLTVIKDDSSIKSYTYPDGTAARIRMCLVRCKCGSEYEMYRSYFKKGIIQSCKKCAKTSSGVFKDIAVGTKIGDCVVVANGLKRNGYSSACLVEWPDGRKTIVDSYNIKNGIFKGIRYLKKDKDK